MVDKVYLNRAVAKAKSAFVAASTVRSSMEVVGLSLRRFGSAGPSIFANLEVAKSALLELRITIADVETLLGLSEAAGERMIAGKEKESG